MRLSLNQSIKPLVIQSVLFLFFAVVTQSVFFYNLNFSILKLIQGTRSEFFDRGLMPFVLLGSPEISISILLAISIRLYKKKKYQKAYLVLCALLLLTGGEFVMKHFFPHERVPYEFRRGFLGVLGIGTVTLETPYSFPSGHSLRSMLMLSVLFAWLNSSKVNYGALIIGIIFCIQVFGMNYYGFHWSTDVLGGYWFAWIGFQTIRYLAGERQ